MQDVSEMKIYQNALKLLIPIQRLANLLPTNEFDFKDQLLGAARAIAPQIAEGFAKKQSQAEFRRFLNMALGSSDEVITHQRQIALCHFPKVKTETCETLIYYYKIESKQINSCIKAINKRSDI